MKKTFIRILSVAMTVAVLITTFSCFFGQSYAYSELYFDNSEVSENESAESVSDNNGILQQIIEQERALVAIYPDETDESDVLSTQGSSEYNFLYDQIYNYAPYSSEGNVSMFRYSYETEGEQFTYYVGYDFDNEKLFCAGYFFDGALSAMLILDKYPSDGYILGCTYKGGSMEVYGATYVRPGDYKYHIDFEMFDKYGDYYNLPSDFYELINENFNSSSELALRYCNYLMEKDAGINLGNFGFTKEYTPVSDYVNAGKRYRITYDANGGTGAPESQLKKHGQDIYLSTQIPVREGYKFLGWGGSPYSSSALFKAGDLYNYDMDAPLYAVWTAVTTDENGVVGEPRIWISNNPGTLTVDIETVVHFHVESENLPDGAYAVVFLNGKQKTFSRADTYSFGCTSAGTDVIEVKLCDAQGNIMLDSNGNEIKDRETIVIRGGFFRSIIAFFKKLFGRNHYYQD